MDKLTCPHCGKQVEISEALSHQLQGDIEARLQSEHKKNLEEAVKAASEKTQKKIQEEIALTLKEKESEVQEKATINEKLQEQLIEMTKALREMKQKDQERELEMQKKLSAEEDKIRLDAQKKAEEEQHLKILEKDKQLEAALKEVEDMRRKLQQGSQQMQGEAFELEFEDMLRREFPNDKTQEVAKGTRGGDILQEVWDRNGNSCGKILWELKNTKTWSEQWIDKLKIDQRQAGADFAVIVSEVVPANVESARFYKNVWIAKKEFVVGLAGALRLNLIQISMARKALEGSKDKKDDVYAYLSSTEFRLRIEAIVEAFTNMQTEIEKEKRYFNNKWARDEKSIRQVIDNTYGMHGDLKGIMQASLPEIKGLNLLEDGTDN